MAVEKAAALFRLPSFKTIEVVETGLAARAEQQSGGNQLQTQGSHG